VHVNWYACYQKIFSSNFIIEGLWSWKRADFVKEVMEFVETKYLMSVNSVLIGTNFVTYVQLIITSQLEATVAVSSSRTKSINAVWFY
jgi:hypothetical protein